MYMHADFKKAHLIAATLGNHHHKTIRNDTHSAILEISKFRLFNFNLIGKQKIENARTSKKQILQRTIVYRTGTFR